MIESVSTRSPALSRQKRKPDLLFAPPTPGHARPHTAMKALACATAPSSSPTSSTTGRVSRRGNRTSRAAPDANAPAPASFPLSFPAGGVWLDPVHLRQDVVYGQVSPSDG